MIFQIVPGIPCVPSQLMIYFASLYSVMQSCIQPPVKIKKYGGEVPTPEPEPEGETAKGISTGGRRQTNISITLENLVENMNISQEGFETATEDMEEQLTSALLRVLNSANQTANG